MVGDAEPEAASGRIAGRRELQEGRAPARTQELGAARVLRPWTSQRAPRDFRNDRFCAAARLQVTLCHQQVIDVGNCVACDAECRRGTARRRQWRTRRETPVEDGIAQLTVQRIGQRALAATRQLQFEREYWLHEISKNWLTQGVRLRLA